MMRLSQGQTVRELARIIQEDWHLLVDRKRSTLETMLYRYNREVVNNETVERVLNTVANGGRIEVTTLQELTGLCKIQRQRVEKALATESKSPVSLNSQTTDQIRLLGSMLNALAKLQVETGLLPRAAPKTVQGIMLGTDGVPTAFGWSEDDDQLLKQLHAQSQTTVTVNGDESGSTP